MNNIRCRIRKRDFIRTPEEEVRQAVLDYLIEHRDFPEGLFSVENTVSIHGRNRRTDILVHDRKGDALMIIECKAASVGLDQSTIGQIALYNFALKAKYLMVSNGIENHIFVVNSEEKRLERLEEVPFYNDL